MGNNESAPALPPEQRQSDQKVILDPIVGQSRNAAKPVVFTWNGGTGAKHVEISGSFNGWRSRIPLVASGDNFLAILNLPPGRIQFKYIVDGVWKTDPEFPTVQDPAGNTNNVLEISAPASSSTLLTPELVPSPSVADYGQVFSAFDDSKRHPPLLPPMLSLTPLNGNQHATNYLSTLPLSQKNSSTSTTTSSSATPAVPTKDIPPASSAVSVVASSQWNDPPTIAMDHAEAPVRSPSQFGLHQCLSPSLSSPTDFAEESSTSLAIPLHSSLGHLYATPHEKFLALGCTQRFRSKFTTTVFYKATPPKH